VRIDVVPAPAALRSQAPLVTAIAVIGSTVLPVFLAGALGPQIGDEAGFDTGGLGWMIAAFFAAGALSSAMLGRLAERIGAHRALRLGSAGSAVAQLLIAATPARLPLLTIALFAAGLANTMAQPAANIVVSQRIPLERQGIAMAVKQSAIPAATIVAGLAVPLVGLTIGWRWAFVGGAVLAALASRSARSVTDLPTRPTDGPVSSAAESPVVLVILALGAWLAAGHATMIAGFLVDSGEHAGLSPSVAGLMLSVGSVSGITSRLLLGSYVDRHTVRALTLVVILLAAGAGAALLLAPQKPLLHVVATPLMFATGWAWPGLFNLAVVRARADRPGAATGVTQTGTYLGAVTAPLAFGALVEATDSYATGWVFAAAWALLAAAVMGFANRWLRRSGP
jgi:predicted MFS family arabinose efflux permease